MQKSKGFLKKSCALVLTLSTFLTTVASSGLNTVFAEESTEVIESEAVETNTEMSQEDVSQDTTEVTEESTQEVTQTEEETPTQQEETPKVSQSSIYVKLNEGGTVVVSSGSGTQTIEKSEGKVTVKDSHSSCVDVTNSLVNGCYLVTTEDVGSVVTVEATAKQGYSVETYRILTDSGEVAEGTNDFATFSDNYTHDVTVSEISKYVTVSFKEDVVEEDTTSKENEDDIDLADLSSDNDDWKKIAEADPNWLCRGDELLTPEEMQEAYEDLGLGDFENDSDFTETYENPKFKASTFALRSASAGTSGIITFYQKATYNGHTVGTFTVNNQLAFCADHHSTTPAQGTAVTSLGTQYNDNLRKVLYYGYGGPASVVGNSTGDRVMTTLCTSVAMGTHTFTSSSSLDYYNNLINRPTPSSGFEVTLWTTGNSAYQRLATWSNKTLGNLSIKKSAASGCASIVGGNNMYSLAGAKFNVYSDSALTKYVGTLTTDANGNTNSLELDEGKYYVKEVTAPKGYSLMPGYKEVYVSSGVSTTLPIEDDIQGDPAAIRLAKQPNSNMTSAAGNTYLEGAEYTVKYYDNDSWSGSPKKTWIYKTDNLGYISFNDDSCLVSGTFYYGSDGDPIFLNGTYSVQETKAPTGYNLDPNVYQATVNGADSWTWTTQSSILLKNYNSATGETALSEEVWKGSVRIHKEDVETGDRLQGDSSHSGIKFAIVNKSDHAVSYDGDIAEVGEIVTIITTDSNGDASTPSKSLEYGSYEIYEYRTNESMTLSDTFRYSFDIDTDGQEITVPSSWEDMVVRGGVQVTKYDKELNKSEALGGATLEGIDFEITNQSANSVIVDGVEYQPGQVVKTITTHWNKSAKAYTAETSSDCLPYGTYTIKEVKTNSSYLLSDGNARTFKIRQDGVIVKADSSNNKLIWKNQVVRGDVKFVKIADTTSRRVSAPFIITNVETGEQHVVVTDANGEYNTNVSWNKHTTSTNANDKLLDVLKDDPTHCFKASDLDPTAGVWFGKGEFGSMADVNDNLGALPYGTYNVTEVRCDANASFDLQSFQFIVYKDSTTVDLGTVTNDEVPPTIHTVALDSDSERHVSKADEDVTIIDTVRVTGLVIGDEYTIKGKVMDYEDENIPISVNADGKVRHLRAEVTFVANSPSMDIEIPFHFDGSTLANKTGVCYESLYRHGRLLVEETDIDNPDQAFHFPVVTTEARDFHTEDNVGNSLIGKVVDKVTYTNLVPDDDYTMKGILYNKADGSVVAEGSTDFNPSDADGTVEVVFEFNQDVQGMDLVATEELIVNNAVVAEHKDMEDEKQTIHYPSISTSAKDVDTDDHVGKVDEEATIEDVVECKNLVVGKEYTIKGKLINKDTGKDLGITAETTFTAEEKNESHTLTFKYNTSELAGKTVVVFEDLFHNNVNVATHSDLEDFAQSVFYPEITTYAFDTLTKDKVCALGNTSVVDTVHCTNLVVDEKYILSGVLMDKDSNDYLLDAEGNPIRATAEFTAEDTTQDVSVIFPINTDTYEGKTIVAYETLIHNDVTVRTHTDLEDKDQTVNVIKVRTKAKSQTELKEMYAGENQTIIDTVVLDNLVVDKEYTIKGNLRLKSTGDPIIIDGSLVTAETTFTATDKHMEVDLVFNLDARALKNETVVVFEDVYFNEVLVGSHADIKDKEQSIRVPKVLTKAFDDKTLIDESLVEDKVNITDTVKYYNLEDGATYTVKGTVMDKETGLPITEDGKYLVGSTTFVAGTSEVLDAKLEYVDNLEEAFKSAEKSTTDLGKEVTGKSVDGSVNVAFSIKASEFGGRTIVMYENLYRDGVLVASHNDIADEEQDIKFIKIGTEARDKVTESHEMNYGKDSTIVDTVSYENVTVGTTYKLVATLKDKETGEAIIVDGKEVTAEKTFTAESTEGSVDVEIPFDSTILEGKTVVVFESMYNTDKLVALHIELSDEGQTIYIPKVRTSAIDKENELKETLATTERVIVDTLSYENLEAGKTYTIKGILMDKDTNKPVMVGGKEVSVEKEFIAGKDYSEEVEKSTEDEELDDELDLEEEFPMYAAEDSEVAEEVTDDETTEDEENKSSEEGRVSGTVKVDFEFDATELEGKTVVLYEEIYSESGIVAHHTDIDDESQTVTIPKVRTTALDRVSNTHEQQASETAKIVDRVKYSNLKVGKEYVVNGILMDKATNDPLLANDLPITSTVVFTPKEKDGYVDVVFEFDSSLLAGTDIVVFEELTREGRLVAIHADIEDEEQTVKIIDIKTTATDATNGTHEMTLGTNVVLDDKVEYTNLTVGKNYTIKGTVVDKATGEAITTAEATFNPTEPNSTVDVLFNLNTDELQGKTLVVFEELYDSEGKLVATHKDIEDEGQTVTVPVKPEIPKTTDNYGWLYVLGAGLLVLGLGSVAFILYRRKRSK